MLLAPLLQAIVTQAIPSLRSWAGWRFRARLWRERNTKGNWAFWLGSCALLTLPAYVTWLGMVAYDSSPAFPLAMVDRAVRDVHWLGTLLTGGVWQASVKNGSLGDLAAAAFMAFRSEPVNALIVLGLVLFVASWVLLFSYTLRPFPASPAILVASMEKRFSLSKAEAQTDFRQRFRRHFGQVARALQPKTMVIFIDDLDRCKPEKAAELLEAANYLSDAGPCFLILGVARDIVEAQVANAHKVVAEEQAAMKRVRDGATVAAPANSDPDRLDYAQKYLRKLVQLDIALPRLDAERSIQILLGKPKVDALPVAGPSQKLWPSAKAWSSIFIWTFLLGSAAVIYWRADLTFTAIKADKAKTVEDQAESVKGLRVKLEEVRLYATWLNDMASAKPSGTEKLLPSPMLYKARADMMQTVVRDLDAGLALLEREAPDGQSKTFDGLNKKVFKPGYDVFTAYVQREQIDGRQWRTIQAGLLPTGAPPAPPTPPTPPNLNRSNTGAVDRQASTNAAIVKIGVPWGHLIAGLLPALLLLWVAFRAKDNYTEHPSPEYQKAVRIWQQELLRNPATASPREMKRFMNLSRYAVARLQAMIKTAPPGTPLPISETCVVELTAKWLSRDRALSSSDLRSVLHKNGAKEEEVELFLKIVGDLSEGDAKLTVD